MVRIQKVNTRLFIILILILMVSLIFEQNFLYAAEESGKKDDRPERGIFISPEYPGIVISKGEKVKMDIIIYNKGRQDENINIELTSIPKGWKALIKTYEFTVNSVHVPDGKSKNLTFSAEPEPTVGTGKYAFKVDASTQDGKFKLSQDIVVTVLEKKVTTEKVVITSSYPVLRGPSDAKFEFSLDVTNNTDGDKTFNLFARGPKDWEVNFKPPYETKYISSLRIKSDQNQAVAVEVTPPKDARAGEYPVFVEISSEKIRAEAKLLVFVTGTYRLDMGTPTGLLSLETFTGKPANVSIYVKNTGSAPNRDINFMSFKPENWKVKFEPEKVDLLEPGQIKQVEVTITPAEQSLVGDYSVILNVNGEKATNKSELRVTVKASTAWGWIGIGIIVLVIAGLCGLFIWLGRR